MASLKKRNGIYYVRFQRRTGDKLKEKSYSLKTGNKREAEKLRIEYEERFLRGEINPFGSWTPQADRQKKLKKIEGNNLSLKKACELFIKYRSNKMNEVTRGDYRTHFNMLMKQVGETMPINLITKDDIREFCFRKDIKPATQASYLRHLKVLFRWLKEQEYLNNDITAKIDPPKVPRSTSQKVISRKQFLKIIEAYRNHNKKQIEKGYITQKSQMRPWFEPLIWTVYLTGLRSKEVRNLRWEQIKLEPKGLIGVYNTEENTTKSGQERIIPFRKGLYEILKKWHLEEGEPTTGYVFSKVSFKSNEHRMSSGYLSKALKKFKDMAGIDKDLNIHGLRHTCATDLLRNNVSPVIAQKFMGHQDIKTTMLYEHLVSSDVQRAIYNMDENEENY